MRFFPSASRQRLAAAAAAGALALGAMSVPTSPFSLAADDLKDQQKKVQKKLDGAAADLEHSSEAARKALAKAGLETKDIDLFEINEAFAAVAMRFMRDMGITDEITNVNGGAIAMGHPLGATGAMILGTLIDELQRRDQKRGLATLCVGGGMGIATIVEIV